MRCSPSAKAQALAGQIEARRQQAAAKGTLAGEAALRPHITGGFGGGLSVSRGRDASGDIASALLDGTLNYSEAVNGLESLRKTGYVTEEQFLDLAKSITDFGVAGENLKVFQELEKALGGDAEATRIFLRETGKSKSAVSDATKELERQTKATDTGSSALTRSRKPWIAYPAHCRIANVRTEAERQRASALAREAAAADVALLLLAGCGASDGPPSDWNPLKLPPGVEEKLVESTGAEAVDFIVSPPTDASRNLGWICGMVSWKGADDMRFFIYEQDSDELRLQPEISPADGQAGALKLLSFMEYKKPCDER